MDEDSQTFEAMVKAVREFHIAGGHAQNTKPTLAKETQLTRSGLIVEEASEYIWALASDDLEKVADALGDLLFVVIGAAITHGLDLEGIFWEIHNSNMSKQGKDNKGKGCKTIDWKPPDLSKFTKGKD